MIEEEMSEILQDKLTRKGIFKSSAKVIQSFVDRIEKEVLSPDETLNNLPSSFVNIVLQDIGKYSAMSYYEQMMYKNELTASTAIKLRSLLNKLNKKSLKEIYANPSSIVFGLGFDYESLIKYGVNEYEGNNATGSKRLRINKNFVINVEGKPNFTLDHDIDIYITNNTYTSFSGGQDLTQTNIYAKFDVSSRNDDISIIKNPFIKSQTITHQGKKVFILFIPMRQYERHEKYIEVTTKNEIYTEIFNDGLYAFELYYKDNSKEKPQYVLLKGNPDGIVFPNSYNYNLEIDKNKGLQQINFSFSELNKVDPNIGDSIKIITYTTKGTEGNFNFPNIFENYKGLSYKYSQDRSDLRQDALVNIIPWLTLKDDEALGGRDMMNFNQIRDLVIRRGSNTNILTPGQLEKKATEFGFITKKVRDDIRCLEFRASGVLKNDNGNIISSAMKDLSFIIDKKSVITNTRGSMFINPTDVFVYNEKTGVYEFSYADTHDKKTYNAYKDSYGQSGLQPQLCFPFTLKINTEGSFRTNTYNLNVDNKVYEANFEWFNAYSPHEVSIQNVQINRNILMNDIEEEKQALIKKNKNNNCYPISVITNMQKDPSTPSNKQDITGFYNIDFIVVTTDIVVNTLYSIYKDNANYPETPNNIPLYEIENETIPIKFRIKFTNKIKNRESYYVDAHPVRIDKTSKSVTLRAYLPVNGVINVNNDIEIVNNTLTPMFNISDMLNTYSLEEKLDIELGILIRDSRSEDIIANTKADGKKYLNFITLKERSQSGTALYYVSTIYSVKDVKLYEDITDKMFINVNFSLMESKLKRSANALSDIWDEVVFYKNVFDTFEENIYKKYEEPVIMRYSDDVTDGVNTNTGLPIVTHCKGDAVLLKGQVRLIHNAGDFVLDSNGEKILLHKKNTIKYKLKEPKVKRVCIKYRKHPSIPNKYIEVDFMEYTTVPSYYTEDDGDEYKVIKYCDAACYKYARYTGDETYINDLGNVQNRIEGELIKDKYGHNMIKNVKYLYEDDPYFKVVEKNFDIGNVPIFEDKEQKVKINIKHTPTFNRIYQDYEPFKTVLKSIYKLFNRLDGIKSYTPDGVTLSLGIRNTTGAGDYEVFNMLKNEWEPIDDISLSFKLGLKLKDNILTPSETVINNIKKDIVEYIENFDEVSFSISDLFQIIKQKNADIDYIILYNINSYSSNEVQSIRKKQSQIHIEDVLCIKQIYSGVDEFNQILFQPDITIRLI